LKWKAALKSRSEILGIADATPANADQSSQIVDPFP